MRLDCAVQAGPVANQALGSDLQNQSSLRLQALAAETDRLPKGKRIPLRRASGLRELTTESGQHVCLDRLPEWVRQAQATHCGRLATRRLHDDRAIGIVNTTYLLGREIRRAHDVECTSGVRHPLPRAHGGRDSKTLTDTFRHVFAGFSPSSCSTVLETVEQAIAPSPPPQALSLAFAHAPRS